MDITHEQRLTEAEARSKSNSHRLDEHDERFTKMERRQEKLDELISTVKVLATREENVENDVKEIKNDVKALTNKPGKMWDSVIEKTVMVIVAAVVGFFLAQIGL
jgi:predicted  nucleic acid-binding Zn-ribbon protein